MNHPNPSATRNYPTVDYDEHARTCAPGDFWAQVKRTVGGKVVSEEHVDMIMQAIRRHLAIEPKDIVLDLACGNGALSARLFRACSSLVGVDISSYMIDIANQHFAAPPQFTFAASGAAEYVCAETMPERFTKVMCYASFSYLSEQEAQTTLQTLHSRFVNVDRVFIGNVPDGERAAAFYAPRIPEPGELTDPRARIGIWRTRAEFAALAAGAGWDTEFGTMPEGYFSGYYRYDVVLHRRSAPNASREQANPGPVQ
ncbi:methyltransferase domain-containing protein [Trinickia violacea]|uniref:Methyltransferase domain-containing protein n=1 Tax=Trinickia violacea TaxID=2571746 RepID=A0A4P8IGM4_9BURK|nr:class I SAM-dependent methyltransferase [Trinickia violacea]QCP47748.1 methyltransferase domain-containing protein [Trinickia violacea]